ncbi:uncharacterized protein SPSK_00942 [Sporothrix schenckii 1099-18]|uniref:Uncharacterized protein n=1 Tax=Sporothrix schenckii 1099-18 TaxID=1397361 RepID=A0A0F2LWE0_SPOSC|nr:uncharacterized protein SPSK_00942 [Sporothrix schenckii 1099-18]KJR81787.1 hypothetical protein SPSK_00942 [Sporothrix schenckii 1099-18]
MPFPVYWVGKGRATISGFIEAGRQKRGKKGNEEQREGTLGTVDTTADAPGRSDRQKRGKCKKVRQTRPVQNHTGEGVESVHKRYLSRDDSPMERWTEEQLAAAIHS